MHLVSDLLEPYIEKHSSEQDEILAQLWRETHLRIQMPQMVSGNIQGKFLSLLSRLVKPSYILEVGTFTGYSAICLAKGLTENGKLITIDINEELAPMCQRYFELSGDAKKIQQVIGNALDILPTIDNDIDIVFIDADKQNYSNYYDLVIDKVKSGGLIVADNVLWSGKVAEGNHNKDTAAIHAFNEKVNSDPRVENFILSLRDGLNIIQKIS